MKTVFVLVTLLVSQQALLAETEGGAVGLLSSQASGDTRFRVFSNDSTVEARIEREAAEVLKRVQADLGPSTIGAIPPPITIYVYPGAKDATGFTQYVPTGRNRLSSIEIRSEGNIEGIIDDVLPREITHIVLAEQIGVPPRWAAMGAERLAESEATREETWSVFRQARDAGRLIPTGKLLTLEKLPKEADEARLMYAQSMALVKYIVQRWESPTFVALAGDAKRMKPSEALQERLGFDSVGEFDLAFRQWAATK